MKLMLIKTKDFDSININEEDIISFPKGVYAFSDVKEFVILNQDADNGIVQLQAVKEESPRFIMFDPFMYIKGYDPDISENDLKSMKAASSKELNIFVIAVVPEDISKITVNLKSPILINFKANIGMQCILEGNYPTRCLLLADERTVG
jgi:flagellar assembly factor FliW